MIPPNATLSIMTALFLLLGTTAFGTTIGTKPLPKSPTTAVEIGTDVNNLVFTGTVRRIPDGTALVTNTSTYLLTGGNFDSIVGKEVNILGKVVREGSIEKIKVGRTQLAPE